MQDREFNNRVLVCVLFTLCQLDLVLTTAELQLGLVYEANPAMGYFVAQGIHQFILAKSILSLVCCCVFYRYAQHPLCGVGLSWVLLFYLFAFFLHVVGVADEVLSKVLAL